MSDDYLSHLRSAGNVLNDAMLQNAKIQARRQANNLAREAVGVAAKDLHKYVTLPGSPQYSPADYDPVLVVPNCSPPPPRFAGVAPPPIPADAATRAISKSSSSKRFWKKMLWVCLVLLGVGGVVAVYYFMRSIK